MRTLLSTILIILVGLAILGSVAAQVISHTELKIDTSIVKDDRAYSEPDSIVVVPIFAPTSDFTANDTDWFRGLFYFLVGNENHSGFTDIPFHYVVTKDGRIFNGNKGGEERKVSIDGQGSSQVVIGYLANRSDTSFDPRSTEALGALIIEVANKNYISLDKVTPIGVKYIRNDAEQKVSLQKTDLFGTWGGDLAKIINDFSYLYSPSSKEYLVEVLSVTLPTEAVDPGQTVSGSIKIKNNSIYGIYTDSGSQLLASSSGNSKFFLRNVWPSATQFYLEPADGVILPGEEDDLAFSIRVPMYFGEQVEDFTLKNANGYSIQNSSFQIKLDINRPSGTIVEVRNNASGFSIVRSQPYQEAGEISRISTGERFLQLDTTANGWAQIDLGDGITGWTPLFNLNYL